MACSLFERSGEPIAYITDAPTYAGFTARASLCQHATIFSVEMDGGGALPSRMREQIQAARDQATLYRSITPYQTVIIRRAFPSAKNAEKKS
ncbi:MAG: hypothetical protein CM15mP120_02490 [Pseudomonadota bacterium]|nr:MAG: hypothetical protein CM15mP120_02490 [Pseudomonadota bacterium]